MNLSIQIGCKIKQMRLQQGLSQRELANKAGIATSYLRVVECGGNFSLDVLEKIALTLEVEPVDLFQK